MTTPEADALLAAVLAAPDDDAPRLVYADWLDERGRPERAEFIRLQIERFRLAKHDPRRNILGRRADRLFDRHGADWVAELPQLDGITWGDFDRGLPRGVRARTLTDFERAASQLTAVAPIDTLELHLPDPRRRLSRAEPHPSLRTLRVRQPVLNDRVDELFNSPLLSTLETLELHGLGMELEGDGLTALVRSGRLQHLRALVLNQSAIGNDGLIALAGARNLRNLTRLSIRGDGGGSAYGPDSIIRSDGIEALTASHVFANLESLDLSGNEVNDEAVAFLVQSPHLVNLKELNLAQNNLSDRGLEILEEAGWEMRLECLDLSRNPIGDQGAHRLGESEVLNELIRLNLDRCEIGPEGAEALARADWFPTLRALSLIDNEIGPGVRAIAATGASLGELQLRGNEVGSAGARAIAGSAAMAGLLHLDLASNGLGAEGVRLLGTSSHMRQLAVLDVAYNGMPREAAGSVEPAVASLSVFARTLVYLRLDGNFLAGPGVLGLVTDVEWESLGELGLRDCGINAPALAYFARDGQFSALTRLGLSANSVDPTGLNELLRARFAAGLSHLDLSTNRVGNDGARTLAQTDLPRLRWLSLERNGVRGRGFVALIRSNKLPRLTTVRYAGNPAGEWWRQLPDRFRGDEEWPIPPRGLNDEDIPF
jgi:uncharacterized protein (TIGR02996 family)